MVNRGQDHTGANVVSTDRSKGKQIGRGHPTYNQERSPPRNQDIERIKSILGDIGDPSIKAALESIIADPTMKALPSNIAKTSTNKTASRSHEKQHFEHTITGTLTDAEMLSTGLSYAGFNLDRQRKVCTKTNLKRFKAFFGLPPSTIVPIFSDLSRKFPKIRAREFLMTMNWFTLYEVFPVLAGRWGRCEDHIGPTIKEYGEMIQSLLSSKIKFEFDNTSRVFVASYDTVNFLVQEFRLDPSSKWFDVKSHSSGLVRYSCFPQHISDMPKVLTATILLGLFYRNMLSVFPLKSQRYVGLKEASRHRWQTSHYFEEGNVSRMKRIGIRNPFTFKCRKVKK
jgi:hypothetical protein